MLVSTAKQDTEGTTHVSVVSVSHGSQIEEVPQQSEGLLAGSEVVEGQPYYVDYLVGH